MKPTPFCLGICALVALMGCQPTVKEQREATNRAVSAPSPTPGQSPVVERPPMMGQVRGQDALLEAATTLRSRIGKNVPLTLNLTIDPDGRVKGCALIRSPAMPESSLVTDHDAEALCGAAYDLVFPATGDEFEYGMTLAPSHLG